MDKEMYIKYIVSYVGAKKETKADIYMDRLIFKAQSYFNDKGDSKNSALAYFYSAWVYYTNNKLPQLWNPLCTTVLTQPRDHRIIY